VGLPPLRLRATVRALRKTSGITTALPRFSTIPPSWSVGSDAASRLKSRWLVAPSAAPSAVGCWWMMSAPSAACTVTGMPQSAAPSNTDTSGAASLERPLRAWARASPSPCAATAPARGLRELPDDGPEVFRGQDIGKGIQEGAEARIVAGGVRVGEERRVDFVGALRDGDRLQPGEVRLAVIGHWCSERGVSEYSLSLSVTWPNENFDCSASVMRRVSSESHIRASAFSAKMPPPLGMRGRTTIASHFLPATLTFSRFRTSTITG